MITSSPATTTDPRAWRWRTRRSRTCRRSWLLSPTPWGATWLWMTTATRRSTPSPWCDSRKPDSEERGIFPPWRPDQHCGLEPGREARQNRRRGAGQWSHAGVDPSQDMGHACFSFPVEKLTCTFACVWPPICFLQVSVNLVCICHGSQRQPWHAPKLGLVGGWPVGRQPHLWHHGDLANGQN